jgi:putative hemolysin
MPQPNSPELYINLEESIRASNSSFLKKLPRFSIRILKWIIRQDKLNKTLTKFGHLEGLAFLEAMLKEMNVTVEIHGKENLPENGRCFFAANHPFGILDGLILTHIVASKYGNLTAIANDAFMLIPQLKPFITEVNVYGSSSKERIRVLNEMYASDLPITHFPAGEVSRIYNNDIQDARWQKSFIKKAIENKRDIVPIRFAGKNSNLFYTIFKMRRTIGLDMNIELVLLPREFFRMHDKTIHVYIGKPISYQHFTAEHSHEEWAQGIRAEVYDLSAA